MNICFSITKLDDSRGWPRLYSEVEGVLSVIIDGKSIFNEGGILLLELAHELARWLSTIEAGNLGDFLYESMDYEDSPILEFKRRGDGWDISSVWMDGKQPQCFVLHDDLVKAVKAFIYDLRRDLGEKVYIDDLF